MRKHCNCYAKSKNNKPVKCIGNGLQMVGLWEAMCAKCGANLGWQWAQYGPQYVAYCCNNKQYFLIPSHTRTQLNRTEAFVSPFREEQSSNSFTHCLTHNLNGVLFAWTTIFRQILLIFNIILNFLSILIFIYLFFAFNRKNIKFLQKKSFSIFNKSNKFLALLLLWIVLCLA